MYVYVSFLNIAMEPTTVGFSSRNYETDDDAV